VLAISIITIIISSGILVNTYFIEPYRFKADAEKLEAQMNEGINNHSDMIVEEVQVPEASIDYPEGMLAKYAQLYAANDDLRGWISIPGFEINLPIAQGNDNNYYLKKDIYGKYTRYGVPFFDYRMTNFKTLHRNTVVYGHNMRHDDYIFGMLENYRTIDGFAQAPVIECNTIYGDHTWFVYAVFITNSNPKDDNGYFFPYNFIDVSTEKFASYIKEIDKRKLYTTGVDINETDRILTLQACVYDFDGAMIVVVAREKREGESISVDTSKAYLNPNPKYPQKWYDVNKKNNSYAEDTRW
jgi:sortase B